MESMFEICHNDRGLAELEDIEDGDYIVPTALKKQLAKSTLLKSVRMATVDNFRGEEARLSSSLLFGAISKGNEDSLALPKESTSYYRAHNTACTSSTTLTRAIMFPCNMLIDDLFYCVLLYCAVCYFFPSSSLLGSGDHVKLD